MTPDEAWQRHQQWLEEHDRQIAEHDRLMAEHGRSMAEHDRSMAEHDRRMAEHELNMQQFDARLKTVIELGARTDARLNRAIRLAVREARAERAKRRELDEKITQLASSHLLTEEALRDLKATVQAFIDSLRRGGNGHHSPGPNNP
jgi:hypothetical protein